MIKIRSMSTGSQYYLLAGVRTYAANRWIYYGEPRAEELDTIDTIEDPELGIMVPSHDYKYESPLEPDFDSSFYRTVKRPDTGVRQKPCYHEKFTGYVTLAKPDTQTETIMWNGEPLTLYKAQGIYYTPSAEIFGKLLCNAELSHVRIDDISVIDGYSFVVFSCAAQTAWWGGYYRTYVQIANAGVNTTDYFTSYVDTGSYRYSIGDIPDADWGFVHAFMNQHSPSGRLLPRAATLAPLSVTWDRTAFLKSLARLREALRGPMRIMLEQNDKAFGGLCLEALKGARFVHTNQLEFWKDIAATFSEVGAFQNLANTLADVVTDHPALKRYAHEQFVRLEKFRTGEELVDNLAYDKFLKWTESTVGLSEAKKVAKATGDAYLGTYYGTRLAMSDIEEISKGLSNFIWTYYSEFRKSCRFAHKAGILGESLLVPQLQRNLDFVSELNYTLCYNPYQGISEINELMEELGWGLNFHQIWECIPLSFVVDWVADVTKILAAFDYSSYIQKLAVNYEQLSYHTTVDVTDYLFDPNGDIQGEMVYSVYRRWYNQKPTIIPTATDIFGQPQKHWLQGAALVVSRG